MVDMVYLPLKVPGYLSTKRGWESHIYVWAIRHPNGTYTIINQQINNES